MSLKPLACFCKGVFETGSECLRERSCIFSFAIHLAVCELNQKFIKVTSLTFAFVIYVQAESASISIFMNQKNLFSYKFVLVRAQYELKA